MSQPSWWEWFSAWAARAQLVKLAVVGVFGGGIWGAVMLVWTCRGWFDGLATKAELNSVVEAQRVETNRITAQVADSIATARDLRSDVDTMADVFRWQSSILSALAAKQGINVPPLPPLFKNKESR